MRLSYLVAFVVVFLVLPCLYAACLKASARFLHFAVLWKYVLFYGFLVVILFFVVRGSLFAFPYSLPFHLELIIGFIVQLTFSAWFFRTRGVDQLGQVLGWPGGFKLSALTSLLWGATAVVLKGLALALHSMHPAVRP